MNAIVMLANNEFFLEKFLETYQKIEKQLRPVDLMIVVDTRLKDIRDEVKHILSKGNQSNISRSSVFSFEEMRENVRTGVYDKLSIEGKHYFDTYSLTLKLIIPSYFLKQYEKILYLDDDCILWRDPSLLFDKYECAFTRSIECQLHDLELFEQFKNILEIKDLTLEDYNRARVSAAMYVMSKEKAQFIDECLVRFFNSPYLHEEQLKSLKSTATYTKAFFQEQRFFNFYRFKVNCTEKLEEGRLGQKGTLNLTNKSIHKVPSLIHYGVGKVKTEWVTKYLSLEIKDKEYITEYRETRLG